MRRAGPEARVAAAGIVLLHGRGGSADDLLGLVAAAGLTRVAAVAPQAPGFSWWPTTFLAPQSMLEPHVEAGVAAVTAAVAALEAGGLDRGRIWLAGFSQGGCLAVEAFARAGEGLAGVFALSGGLVGTADAGGPPLATLYGHAAKRFDYPARRDGARAWISVHERDPHIPLARVRDTVRVLRGLGATVETAEYPGEGHGILPADIAALRARLLA